MSRIGIIGVGGCTARVMWRVQRKQSKLAAAAAKLR